MKIAQLRGQPFLTLSSCKGFFGNPHNSNHTNSKPKQQNTSTTKMLLTSMELVGGSIFVEKEKPTFTWKCIPTHGSNWEVKVFLLQVTYSIIFHLIPASLIICCALWPPSGTVWFASRKWIMVRWLEPRAPLNLDQKTATPCNTHMQILVVEVCDLMWFSLSIEIHIPDNFGEWMNGEVNFLMNSVTLWSFWPWLFNWVNSDPLKQKWKRRLKQLMTICNVTVAASGSTPRNYPPNHSKSTFWSVPVKRFLILLYFSSLER